MMTPQPSPYHYPSHILFQLILVNFLRIQEAAKKLQLISVKMHTSLQEKDPCQKLSEELLTAAEELAGKISPFSTYFSWNSSPGLLNILKKDCLLFEKTNAQHFSRAIHIRKQASKSRSLSSELRDLIVHLQGMSSSLALEISFHFQKVEAQFIQSLKVLGRAISQTIVEFKTDENVLFCLIQKQKELDSCYGSGFTYKIIIKMFQTLSSAHSFLTKAYSQRKFDELIPQVTHYIEELRTSQTPI